MLSAEGESGHKDDDDGMPEIGGVRESCDPAENAIIEPIFEVFRSGNQKEYEGDGNGGKWESVSALEPGILEIPRFADDPEKRKKPDSHYREENIVPIRRGILLLFSPYERSCNERSYKEMKSENKRVVRRKPFVGDSAYLREEESHKPYMECEKRSCDDEKNERNIYFPYSDEDTHGSYNEHSSHHIVGDVPKRSVQVDREKSEWVNPSEERRSRQESEQCSLLVSMEKYRQEKRENKHGIVRRSDSKKPTHEEFAGFGWSFPKNIARQNGSEFVMADSIKKRLMATGHISTN